MSLSAERAEDVTVDIVLPALAGRLGGADASQVRSFTVAFTARRRKLSQDLHGELSLHGKNTARALGGIAVVSFDVIGSLPVLGYQTADAFQLSLETDLQASIDDGSLTLDMEAACGCDLEALTVGTEAKQEVRRSSVAVLDLNLKC